MPEAQPARAPLNALTPERMTVALMAGYFLDFEEAPLRDDPRFWETTLSYFEGPPEFYIINPRPPPRRRLLDRLAESFRPEEFGTFPELLKINLASVEALTEALRPIYENISASSTSANSFLGSVVFDVWICFEVLDADQATKVWLRLVREANPFLEEMLVGPVNIDTEKLGSVLGPAISPADTETNRPISHYHRDTPPPSSPRHDSKTDACLLDSLLVDPVSGPATMVMRDATSDDSSDDSSYNSATEEISKAEQRGNDPDHNEQIQIRGQEDVMQDTEQDTELAGTEIERQRSGGKSRRSHPPFWSPAEFSGYSALELPAIDVSLVEDTIRCRANQSSNSVRGYAELAQARLAQNNVAAAFELVCEAFLRDRRDLISVMRNSGRFGQATRELAEFTEHPESGSVRDLVGWLFDFLNLHGPPVFFRNESIEFAQASASNCSIPGLVARAINAHAEDAQALTAGLTMPPRIPAISPKTLRDYLLHNATTEYERIVYRIQSLQAYLNCGEYPSSLREDIVYLRTHFGNLGVSGRKQWIAPFCILNAKIWNAFGHQELCESYMVVARKYIEESPVSVACDLAMFTCFERKNPLIAIQELVKVPTESRNDYYEKTWGLIMSYALMQAHDITAAEIECCKCTEDKITARQTELRRQVDILKYSLTGSHITAAVTAQRRARSFHQSKLKYMEIFYLMQSIRSLINANTPVSTAQAQSLLQCELLRSVANVKPVLLLELMLLRARLYFKLEKRSLCFDICQNLKLLVRSCAMPHLLFEWQVLRRLTCGDNHPDVSSFAIDPLLPSKCLHTELDMEIASELAKRFQIFTLYDPRKCKVPRDLSAAMQQIALGGPTPNKDWISRIQTLYAQAAESNRLDSRIIRARREAYESEKAESMMRANADHQWDHQQGEEDRYVRALVERRAESMRAKLRLRQCQRETKLEEQREAHLKQEREQIARMARTAEESSPTRFNRPKRLLSRHTSPRERRRKRRSTAEDDSSFASLDSD